MEVEYKGIPGYEGIYEAGSDGSIWTCEGKVTHRILASGEIQARVWKQRKLKPKRQLRNSRKNLKEKHYDLRVSLWDKDGNESTKLVARLVAGAFHKNPENYPCVNHIDGDTENNTPDNLEWCSWKYNNRHVMTMGINQKHTSVLLIRGKEQYSFTSLAEASRWLGYNSGYLSGLTKKGISVIGEYTINLYTGKSYTTDAVRPGIKPKSKNKKGVALVEKNGTSHYFASFSQASIWLGRCSGFISNRIKHTNMIVGNFIIIPF